MEAVHLFLSKQAWSLKSFFQWMQWSVENIVITIYCVLMSPIYSIVSYLSSNECAAVKIVYYYTTYQGFITIPLPFPSLTELSLFVFCKMFPIYFF